MLNEPDGATAEAYRVLRANLDLAGGSDGLRSLMVTSPHDDAARTSAAVNLAIAAAQTGRRVALVGLDLRGPGFGELLKSTGGPGIAEIASGSATVADVSVDVALGAGSLGSGRLQVIPRGSHADDPGAVAGSRDVRSAIESLTEQNDMVIVDSPGLLEVSDSIAISASVVAVLVVSDAKSARRRDGEPMRRLLQRLPAAKIGVAVVG
jgi:Mrp family chromosome partitioning ATPase